MEFRALGSLEVAHGEVLVDLGSPKLRALLALLLLHPNEVVATDRIVDALWRDDPLGKENALWVLVSRLRSTLEPQRQGRGESSVLLTRGSGYLLAVTPAQFDVARFEALTSHARAVIAGDPAAASARFREALGLWRGPAYDDVRYEEFAQAEIARLDGLRLTALEDRIDADLACGRDGELVSELEALRHDHPLRERPVGQLMLALYRSGRPAEALRAFDLFRRRLGEETGLDTSPDLRRLEQQILLHDERIRRPVREHVPTGARTDVANPYKGLRPFTEDDVDRFFGRDGVVADMVRVISGGQRMVTVIGASGAGKSSALHAGLVPALRKGAVDGSTHWLLASMVPGTHPFAELEAALCRAAPNGPASLAEQLSDPDAGVLRAVLRVLPDPDSRVVLIIDQFEELFSLVDPETRTQFLDNLVVALDDSRRRLLVVVTLRADFYAHALTHPALGARIGGGIVNITAMSADDLEAAAREPAIRAGVTFDPALLAQLVADVGHEPGALPLFQFALADLFDRRVGDELLLSTYRSMGGLHGSLRRRTDELFDGLTPPEQWAAKQLFLRMVTVTENGERARRRVSAGEILSLGVEAVTMQQVIDAFGRHRLLTFDADPLTGEPTVEVAHEALLGAWDRLAEWIDECRDDLRRHGAFAVAQREWELSGRHVDYLLTGARFDEYEQWSTSSAMRLAAPEQAYLEASAAALAQRQTAEVARQQRETLLGRRARRRLWGLAAVSSVVALTAAAVGAIWITRDDPPRIVAFSTPDNAYGANVTEGLARVDREFDVRLERVSVTIKPSDQLRDLADSNPGLIITDASPFVSPAGQAVVDDHPDVKFGVLDGLANGPNVASITFANEQGAYLVGVAAALTTRTHVVGFVGAFPAYSIDEFQAGFEAGVASVDPTITVLPTYLEIPLYGDFTYLLNAFARPDLARERALALYQRGADVVFQAAGASGFGVFDAAVEHSAATGTHVWAIGVDNDQWYQVDPVTQTHILTSMIKRADVAVYRLAQQFLQHHFQPGAQELGLADGALGYSTAGGALEPATINAIDRAQAEIAAGRIVVPTSPSVAVLDLDPVSAEYVAAIAPYDRDQLDAYAGWLSANYAADFGRACSKTGDRGRCADLMVEHLGEWAAITG